MNDPECKELDVKQGVTKKCGQVHSYPDTRQIQSCWYMARESGSQCHERSSIGHERC